jgi:hypothetical protein
MQACLKGKAPAYGAGLFSSCTPYLMRSYFARLGRAALKRATAAAYQGSFSQFTETRFGFVLFFCFIRVGM